jgi:pimeloyl-ACP methyl ester carboxylesterase
VPLADLAPWRVGYDEIGSGDALLLINGLGFDRASYAVAAQAYAAAGYRVVTLDNPGAGETAGPAGPYTAAQLADVAAALLRHLEIGQAHVFGVSMGGIVAQELALRHSPLVRSLQLHCTWGRSDPFAAELFRSWGELVEAVGHVEVWDHMLLWAMTPEFYGAHPEVVAGYRAMIAAAPPSTAVGFRAQVAACIAHDALDRLSSVTAPALVTTGERDPITTPRHARELCEHLPNARLHLWPGVAHLPFVEAASDFDALALEFLVAAG